MAARSAPSDASVLYTAVSDAVRAKDAAKAKDAALQITDRYARHRLRAARGAARTRSCSTTAAIARARRRNTRGWSITRKRRSCRQIARYRLAQVQIDEKQYDAALATLDAKHPEPFDGLYADLRGDALAAAGRVADARTAYETALAKLDPKSPYRNYVQVKHDALGGAATGTAAAASGGAGRQSRRRAPARPRRPMRTREGGRSREMTRAATRTLIAALLRFAGFGLCVAVGIPAHVVDDVDPGAVVRLAHGRQQEAGPVADAHRRRSRRASTGSKASAARRPASRPRSRRPRSTPRQTTAR